MPETCHHKTNDGTYCDNKAIYGTESYTPLFCKSHKTNKMKYVLGKPLCKCGRYPSYGYSENRARISCAECKETDMIYITMKILNS